MKRARVAGWTGLVGLAAILLVVACAPTPAAEQAAMGQVVRASPTPLGEPRLMFFCGIDRCRNSGEYGELVSPTRINVWNSPEPDRGGVRYHAAHHERATVIRELRVQEGPGGLWFELEGGGWTNDLWLTPEPCTDDNLEEYSFGGCLEGEQ
jgi:hypothetical protein